jgi:hypothetical protein
MKPIKSALASSSQNGSALPSRGMTMESASIIAFSLLLASSSMIQSSGLKRAIGWPVILQGSTNDHAQNYPEDAPEGLGLIAAERADQGAHDGVQDDHTEVAR